MSRRLVNAEDLYNRIGLAMHKPEIDSAKYKDDWTGGLAWAMDLLIESPYVNPMTREELDSLIGEIEAEHGTNYVAYGAMLFLRDKLLQFKEPK